MKNEMDEYEKIVVLKNNEVGVDALNLESLKKIKLEINEYKRFSIPDQKKSICHLVIILMLYIIVISMSKHSNTAMYIISTVYTLHYTLHIAHECWHNLLFENKKINYLIGKILSAIIGFPYEHVKKIHFNHHKYLNEKEDPGFEITNPTLSRNEIILKIVGILIFANHIKNISYILKLIKKDRKTDKENKIKNDFLKDVLFVVLIHLIIMTFMVQYSGVLKFIILEYSVLALLPLVDSVRTLIDHKVGINKDSRGYTRNFDISLIDKIITKPMFDWHMLHHLFPKIPQSRLLEVELYIKLKNDNEYYNSRSKNTLVALKESLT